MMQMCQYFVIFPLFLVVIVVKSDYDENVDVEWFDPESRTVRVRTSSKSYFPKNDITTTTRFRNYHKPSWKTASTITFRTPATETVTWTSSSKPYIAGMNITAGIVTLLRSFSKLMSKKVSLEGHFVDDVATLMKLEFFTIATGNHFLLPESSDKKIEREKRKKAASVAALWIDLFCMEEVEKILTNCSDQVIKEAVFVSKMQNVEEFENVMKHYFEKIDKAFQGDSFLNLMLISQQIRYISVIALNSSLKSVVYFPYGSLHDESVAVVAATVERAVEEWLENPSIRKFLINKLFLELTTKPAEKQDSLENYYLVQSVLKLARKRESMKEMQLIYSKLLQETAENFTVAEYPRRTIDLFLQRLKERTEDNGILQPGFKKEMTKIRGSTSTWNPEIKRVSKHIKE